MKLSRFSSDWIAVTLFGLGLLAGAGNAIAQRPMGIDVSSFQENINWTDVKNGGYTFAWAKATQGNYYIDAYFTENEANAKAAGVYIGAYDFADYNSLQGTNGANTEAAYFWNEAGPYVTVGGYYMMPMLDVEEALTNNTGSTVTTWVNQWCDDIVADAAAKGVTVKPIVYTYTSFASDYLGSSVTQWPLWMASPNGENPQTGAPNSTSPWSTWTFWQYDTSDTSVPGITTGQCDQDVFNGTAGTLLNYLIGGGGTAAPAGATLYWDPNDNYASPGSGGTGNWDLSTANWWYTGTSNWLWTSSGSDIPVFAGTAGTVTLNASLSSGSLTFTTPGYIITGTGNTLSFRGGPTISVPPPSSSPTYIDCILSGSSYTVTGGGVLVLNNTANTSTPFVIESNSTLEITSSAVAGSSGTVTISGGSTLLNSDATSGDAFLSSSINIVMGTGGGYLNDSTSLSYGGVISGSGSLTKVSSGRGVGGTMTLTGTNTYTGSTTISQGTLALGSTGSINDSSAIIINAGTAFDVSAIASYTLSSSTTLSASGTSTAAAIKGGTTVSLGSRPITLTYDGSHPALTISQGTLSLNGNAFTVNGSTLAVGTYTIVQQTSGNISSSGSYSVTGTAIGAGTTAAISVSGGNVVLTIADTTTTTLNSLSASTYGQSVTFTATIAPTPSGGTAQFYDNSVALGSPMTVSSGHASYTSSKLAVGSHPITASYSGTTGYAASTTASASTQQVNQASLGITASAQSKTYGTLLTFGSGSTNFTSSGLQNSETVGTVTLAVSGNGGATSAPVGTYIITPSAATGGTFTAGNYNITYNTGTLTVNLPPNTTPVTITGATLLTNGVQMTFAGTPGYVYLIEVATNLAPPITWTTLSTNAADSNGLFNFTDTNASNYNDRYYQTVAQ